MSCSHKVGWGCHCLKVWLGLEDPLSRGLAHMAGKFELAVGWGPQFLSVWASHRAECPQSTTVGNPWASNAGAQGRGSNALHDQPQKSSTATSIVFCWWHRPTLIQRGRGLHKGGSARRWQSLNLYSKLTHLCSSWGHAAPECLLFRVTEHDIILPYTASPSYLCHCLWCLLCPTILCPWVRFLTRLQPSGLLLWQVSFLCAHSMPYVAAPKFYAAAHPGWIPFAAALHLMGPLYSILWMEMMQGFPLHCLTGPPVPCTLSHTSLNLEDSHPFSLYLINSLQEMFFAVHIQIFGHLLLEAFAD